MTKGQKKTLSGIFANLAQYSIGLGIIGGLWAGKLTAPLTGLFTGAFFVFTITAYILSKELGED